MLCCTELIKWPLLVQTVSIEPAAEASSLPAGVQLMIIGVKLSRMLVAVAMRSGQYPVVGW